VAFSDQIPDLDVRPEGLDGPDGIEKEISRYRAFALRAKTSGLLTG